MLASGRYPPVEIANVQPDTNQAFRRGVAYDGRATQAWEASRKLPWCTPLPRIITAQNSTVCRGIVALKPVKGNQNPLSLSLLRSIYTRRSHPFKPYYNPFSSSSSYFGKTISNLYLPVSLSRYICTHIFLSRSSRRSYHCDAGAGRWL